MEKEALETRVSEAEKKINLLFSRYDKSHEMQIRHDEKISLMWKFVIGALCTGAGAFLKTLFDIAIKYGG
jgi:hypothetical protein